MRLELGRILRSLDELSSDVEATSHPHGILDNQTGVICLQQLQAILLPVIHWW